ncbi:MAG: hypothetical protein R3F51_21805 [Cyanobacteriota/Melainabacteria group bacterium]
MHPQDIAFSPVKTVKAQLNKRDLARRIVELSRGRVTIGRPSD